MPSTTHNALPYPSSSAAANVPADLQALAEAIDTKLSTTPLFKTYFVLASGGSDSNTGLNPANGFATFAHLASVVTAAGGANSVLGPGTFALDTTGHAMSSNVAIQGSGMNATILQVTNGSGVGLSFDGVGTPLSNVHLSDLTINFTGTSSQTQALVLGSLTYATIERVRVIGSWYPITAGGHGGYAPLKNARFRDCIFEGSLYDNAIVNVENVVFDDCTFIGAATNRPVIDIEPNGETDGVIGLVFNNPRIYGAGLSIGIQAAWGSAADPQKMLGVQINNPQIFDTTLGIVSALPGLIVNGHRIKATRPLIGGYTPGGGILIKRAPDMPSADGARIGQGVIENMGESGVILEGVSHCHVAPQIVIDENRPVTTNYAVQERQRYAGIVSGFALGTPSSMTVPVSAGVMQKDATGLFPAYAAGATVTKTAQTATITAASAYDRVDTIYLDPVTAVVSVKKGNQPANGQVAAPSYQGLGNFVVVGYVYVGAGVTSITTDKVTDARVFIAHDNDIDQGASATVFKFGDIGLENPDSSRRHRRVPPLRTDAYAKSVLADLPQLYLPLTEKSGTLASDHGTFGAIGHYVGNVQTNRQIGATSRYGAYFDGTSYVQVDRPDELRVNNALCRAPFTLECQVLPDNLSNYWVMASQGGGAERDFLFGLYSGTGKPYLDFGNSSDQVATTGVSTSTLNHVAVDWDGTNLRFYLNGTLDATLTPAQPSYGAVAPRVYWPIVLAGSADNLALPPSQYLLPGFLRHFAMYAPNIGGTRIAAHAALM